MLPPTVPVPGMGLWPEGMLSLCPRCAAGEEGLKDTQAGGELRLPCFSSCCSLGFLCELQSDDARGSLLSGCCTGTWACTFPLCSPGLVPQPGSEPLAGGVLGLLWSPVSTGCCWRWCCALCPSRHGDRGSAFAGADAKFYEGCNNMLHVGRFLGCGVGGVWLFLSEVQGALQLRLFLQVLRLQPLSVAQEDSASF